jgi:hypothetical protein
MILWLDDIRPPWKYGYLGATWCKTADEAIALLRTGTVTFASLDHDLAVEHMPMFDTGGPYKEKTGMAVVEFMIESGIWPEKGVRVHSMNPVGRMKMEAANRGALPWE